MLDLNNIGDWAPYIQDYKFKRLFEIPKEVAMAWVQTSCPDAEIGMGISSAKELTLDSIVGNGWLNKLFIIVAKTNDGKKYAITNWDGNFSLYVSK